MTKDFEEAVKSAPVRKEWLDECSPWQYAWHVAKRLSWLEWAAGILYLASLLLVVVFLLAA